MIDIHLLPARQGDAIWVRWGESRATHQMIVDMGTTAVGKHLWERFRDLPVAKRSFELLVVTHVDSDHIGGVLSCLLDSKPLPGLRFRDVWFNGRNHLKAATGSVLEQQGGVQGKRLGDWLATQNWNRAFKGGPVCRTQSPPKIELPGGLKVSILGPTPQRLESLLPVWDKELTEALKRKMAHQRKGHLEPMGRRKQAQPQLLDATDLAALAERATGADPSQANGSSILLLLEDGRRSVLLAGDAFAQDVLDGLATLKRVSPIPIDAFKLPHHGSLQNTTQDLIHAVDCGVFLFSTDGTTFEHPDPAAVACVIANASRRPAVLGFNCRSTYSTWWDNSSWKRKFGYVTKYGTNDGLRVKLAE